MFGKKRKKIVNKIFGEMEYRYGWNSTTNITLWEKTYNIRLFVDAKTEKDEVNKNQEIAYKNFKESIIEKQKEIEEIIENDFAIRDEQVLSSRFSPTKLLFSVNGECALYVDDNDEDYGPYDDHDVGFVVSIIPKLEILSQEQYSMDILAEPYEN